MARKRTDENQYAISDYQLKQVDVRLKLMDGPSYYSRTPLDRPEAAVDVMRDILKGLDREWLCVVNLDNHLKPVNFNVVSIGSVNESLAPIQNIMKSAILCNCNHLILLHNHPSGDISPSAQDATVTKRLLEAAKLMDMQVLDHLIVGGETGATYSFREEHPSCFSDPKADYDYIHKMENPEKTRRTTKTQVSETMEKYDAGHKNFDPKQAAERRKAELRIITEKLEKGVKEIFTSKKYQQFLDTMAKFPHYSLNNSLLIMLQRPDATLCQSYTGWKRMGRSVRKGEKGIRILAPSPYQIDREREKRDAQGNAILDKDGESEKEKVQIHVIAFKPVSTFDLSQTEGKPLPSLGTEELTGSVQGYRALFAAMQAACPVPVSFEAIPGESKGYFHLKENRIAINEGMSEVQNVKTLIHEMTHQKLHSIDEKSGKGPEKSAGEKEVEAESTAYTVCQHYGIDTSDYSFGYVAGWSAGKELPELKASLGTIRQASAELITAIDEKVRELTAERTEVAAHLPDKETVQTEKERNVLRGKSDEAALSMKSEKPSVRKKLAEQKEKMGRSQHPDKTEKTIER